MTSAYRIAKAGGKHKNFLENYDRLPDHLIEKAIRSVGKQIALHESWIADPAIKLDVNQYTMERIRHYRIKWSRDIERQQEQIGILKGILENRNG